MKYLDYEVVGSSNDNKTISVTITKQDVINRKDCLTKLYQHQLMKKSINGCCYRFCSIYFPEYNKDKNTFYLMGSTILDDSVPLRMSIEAFAIFRLMVIEYNFKRGFEKKMTDNNP